MVHNENENNELHVMQHENDNNNDDTVNNIKYDELLILLKELDCMIRR